MKNPLRLLLAFAALAAPTLSHALCTITCTCLVSTTPVVFGTYYPVSGNAATGVGNVRVTCGGILGLLVPFDVSLGPGMNDAGGFNRRMAKGGSLLRYNLYTGTGTVWGDGSGSTQAVHGGVTIVLLGGTAVDLPVQGSIPGGQNVPVGGYSDTVTVTVTYF